jgi:tetratricopeptide (TPR) repeat protein
VADPSLAPALAALQSGDLGRARRLAEDVLATAPSANVRHLLGLIHCRAGRMCEGVAELRAAAEAEPANPAFKLMLARALIDSGDASEVLAMGEPPRDGAASSLALWHARAEAADSAQDWPASSAAWMLLTDARPADWRAWSNLGNALAANSEWGRAVDALRRSIALNGSDLGRRRNLAGALAMAGFEEAAAAELERALAIDPSDVQCRLALARLLADLGRHEAALAQYDEAGRRAGIGERTGVKHILDLAKPASDEPRDGPRRLATIRELGLLFERTNQMHSLRQLLDETAADGIAEDKLGYLWAAMALRDGDAERARALITSTAPDRDAVRWHRLMAKIDDALGDSAGAFANAAAMNRAVGDFDGWRTKGARYRRQIRALVPVLTKEWAAKITPLAPGPRRSPAFLVGFPRSGTTLLDTFLMGHPDTHVLEELHMLGAAEQVVGRLAELPDRSAGLLERARDAYFAELDRHVDPGFDGLVVDKLPLNMLGLPLIRALFPDSPVIFAQRHPCDCVLSGFMQSFVMNEAMACFLTIEDAADLYDAAAAVWSKSRELLPQNIHTLVYEQLVADPAATLAPLVQALGLRWDETMLDHRATAKARGAITTPSYDQVTQPLTKAPVGRWRRYDEQLQSVLPVLLPWAERLGYSD